VICAAPASGWSGTATGSAAAGLVPAAPRPGVPRRTVLDWPARTMATRPVVRRAGVAGHVSSLPGGGHRTRRRRRRDRYRPCDLVHRDPFADPVRRLAAYRGIGQLAALSITSKVCDWRRFPHGRAGSWASSGWCPPSTPQAGGRSAAKSPTPVTPRCAPSWSSPRGPTVTTPWSASTCAAANKAAQRRRSRGYGKRNGGCADAGAP
jgi:hypothetical protein